MTLLPRRPLFFPTLLALLGGALAGCVHAHKEHIVPIGQGYEEVSRPQRGQPDDGTLRTAFKYLAPSQPTNAEPQLIWPELYGVNEVVHSNLAVFVGIVNGLTPGKPEPRLFLVQAPRTPVDVTDEMLWRWAHDNHRDFSRALEKYTLVTPADSPGRLQLRFEFWLDDGETGWPAQGDLTLAWKDLPGLLQQAEKRAVPVKDARWHTPYLRE